MYSKLLQPKYRYLENLLTIEEIGYFIFSNNSDVVPLNVAFPNSIFVFDDVACDKQDNAIKEYFAMGRRLLLFMLNVCKDTKASHTR